LRATERVGTLRGVDEEETKIVMTTLADIREDVRKLRAWFVEEDFGEEEDQDYR
jgi:hypothetical protein